jgi:hypothetical protein
MFVTSNGMSMLSGMGRQNRPGDTILNRTSYLDVTGMSGELFTLPNGVNEFDIYHDGALYHFFYSETPVWDTGDAWHRESATIAGLASAADDDLPTGGTMSIYYESGTWHLFLGQGVGVSPNHYTTADPAVGPWAYQDNNWPAAAGDPEVGVKIGSTYYGAYAINLTWVSQIVTSSSLGGVWTAQGDIFADVGRLDWHQDGEGDPDLVYHDGQLYILFAGRNVTTDNRVTAGIAPIDTATYRATAQAEPVWASANPWERRYGLNMIQSPRYLEVGSVLRIFYSHNNLNTGVVDGWGYLDVEWK